MSENPYLVPRPGMLSVTVTVEPYSDGRRVTFVRWVDPADYDYENRLACGMALAAISHWAVVHGRVVWDEPRDFLAELADELPDFADATVAINGDVVYSGPASQCLSDLEYAADHPAVDRHVDVRQAVVG